MKYYELDNMELGKVFPYSLGKAKLHKKGFNIHGHKYSELVIITAGQGIHNAEGVTYPIQRGDIFVIHEGIKHGFSQCLNLEMFNVGFLKRDVDKDLYRSVPGSKVLFELEPQYRAAGEFKSRFHASPIQMDQIISIIGEMGKEIDESQPGYRFAFINHFANLIILLGRFYSDSKFKPSQKLIRLSTCIDELESQWNRAVRLEEIADAHGYSLPHFIRSFKRIYGITPLQHIIQLRLAKAVDYLKTGEINISEVAYRCGFEDSNYFSRLFKKKTGLSPRQFRKKIMTGNKGEFVLNSR